MAAVVHSQTRRRESNGMCKKRTVWNCGFLSLLVLAFTAYILAVATPSWQFVYLEDGRTEHHHGLWLDCKRDYSNEYGRPREYYESWKIAALTAHLFALVCALNGIIILFCGFCHRLLICVAAVLVTLSVIGCSIGNVIFYMFASYQDNNIIKEDDGIYEQYFGWSFYASLIANSVLLITSIIGCCTTSAVFANRTQLVKIEIDEGGDDTQLLRLNTVNRFVKDDVSSFANAIVPSEESSSNGRFRRSRSGVYKIDSSALRKWERETMRNVALRNSSFDFKRANSLPNIAKKSSKKIKSHSREMSNSDFSNTLLTDISCPAINNTTKEFIPSKNQFNNFMPKPPSSESDVGSNGLAQQNELIYEYVDENTAPFDDNTSSVFASKFGTFDRNFWLNANQVAGINSSTKINSSPNGRLASNTTRLNTYDRVPIGGFDIDRDEYLKPKSISSGSNSERNSFSGGNSFLGPATTMFATTNFEIENQFNEDKQRKEIVKQKLFCNELQQQQEKRRQKQDQTKKLAQNDRQNKTFIEHETFEFEKTVTNFGVEDLAKKNANLTNAPTANSNNKALNKNEANSGVKIPPKPPQRTSLYQYPQPSAPYLTLNSNDQSMYDSKSPKSLQINTFQTGTSNGTSTTINENHSDFRGSVIGKCARNNRSLVNLVALNNDETSTISVFDRRDSIDFAAELDAAISTPAIRGLSSISTTSSKPSLTTQIPENEDYNQSRTQLPRQYFESLVPTAIGIKETNFDGKRFEDVNNTNYSPSPTNYQYKLMGKNSALNESELDRSMGSITTLAFQNQQIYEGKSPSILSFPGRPASTQSNSWRTNTSNALSSNFDLKRSKNNLAKTIV